MGKLSDRGQFWMHTLEEIEIINTLIPVVSAEQRFANNGYKNYRSFVIRDR